MAVVMTQDLISDDLWTLPEAHVDIYQLQAKDFTKWVCKQALQFGRKAEIANIRFSAVEMWLKELGIEAGFICGGEVNIDNKILVSDWSAIGYYMMDEDGMMETKAGRWLDICKLENQEDYLIGR
jgi:hypothetical protein